jgi:hypothetical protein
MIPEGNRLIFSFQPLRFGVKELKIVVSGWSVKVESAGVV